MLKMFDRTPRSGAERLEETDSVAASAAGLAVSEDLLTFPPTAAKRMNTIRIQNQILL